MYEPSSEKVADVFNDKAATWKRKYDSGAQLTPRLILFGEMIRKCCSSGAQILDFGCGTGDLALHLSGWRFRVTGCDISDKMLAVAKDSDRNGEIDWVLLPRNWDRL